MADIREEIMISASYAAESCVMVAPDASYGVNSEYAPLKSVLLRHPGTEIEHVAEPYEVLFSDFIAPDTARRQHDAFAEQLAVAGVRISYIRGRYDGCPNLYFTRDTVVTTHSGAVMCRPATVIRRRELPAIHQTLWENGIPSCFQVSAPGTLEGGDVCIVSPDLVLIGISARTNIEGARQLSSFLRMEGFRHIHPVPLSPEILHLDMIFAVLDADLIALSDRQAPDCLRKVLADHGIQVVNLPNEEARNGMSLNMLCLGPRHVMLPSGNPQSRRMLERAGVTCQEVVIPELIKGGGAIHCMVAVLERDLVFCGLNSKQPHGLLLNNHVMNRWQNNETLS